MSTSINNKEVLLGSLDKSMAGTVQFDSLSRTIYSTDASVYKETPLGVAYPKTNEDIRVLVQFAIQNNIPLIPRSGGTSLSGQCVGYGLVVDVSRHMNEVIDFNPEKKQVKVQVGIVRDQLNAYLKAHGLFFSPITSTANRATIGGMVGNNSCGTNSIVYGDTRRYVKEIKGVLSDGSDIVLSNLKDEEYKAKLRLKTKEGDLYRSINSMLSSEEVQKDILEHFPKATVTRRNTGYALDELVHSKPFTSSGHDFNFSKIVTGSEGTLLFMTEVTLDLTDLPPKHDVVLIAQFESIQNAMKGVVPVMKHSPFACELMDKIILDCTEDNPKYSQIRSHFKGDPAGSLMIEFRADALDEARGLASHLRDELKSKSIGYDYSIIEGKITKDLWALRSAGLGLLANIPGDAKGVACIEDTAVAIDDLAPYMEEFAAMMKAYGQRVVYYAHAGAGEIHLRPILNLKKAEDQQLFHDISRDSALLVKKYNGSLSGEHGDGRVRAPFIPIMVGENNYKRFEQLKADWDPKNIFNPYKIVHPKSMLADLRYTAGQKTPEIDTVFDFSDVGGILRMAEKCNGSGDCRKLPLSGGTMCPSYQATREEKHTTRARANALRTFLSNPIKDNPFDHPELKEVLDLCVSCKGCTSECPSNVDMTTLKSEWQYQYYKTNGTPLRAKAFAHINELNKLGSKMPAIANFFIKNSVTSSLLKSILGVAKDRSLPIIQKQSLRKWFEKDFSPIGNHEKGLVYFFCDEFTNFNDVEIGKKAVLLLDQLGYEIRLVNHEESGRAALSKGILDKAKKHANANVALFSNLVNDEVPLIGIEPSAILSFRDEYPKLVRKELIAKAKDLARNTFIIEEFLANEIRAFRITAEDFTNQVQRIVVHGHCHQKALSSMTDVHTLLNLPSHFTARILETGCCGMAGSFGYEKEHYEVSQKIGELSLYPQIREMNENELLVASGTSCRHQVSDGLGEKSYHPIEVLFDAVIRSD